jgi:hypothetical protein
LKLDVQQTYFRCRIKKADPYGSVAVTFILGSAECGGREEHGSCGDAAVADHKQASRRANSGFASGDDF